MNSVRLGLTTYQLDNEGMRLAEDILANRVPVFDGTGIYVVGVGGQEAFVGYADRQRLASICREHSA